MDTDLAAGIEEDNPDLFAVFCAEHMIIAHSGGVKSGFTASIRHQPLCNSNKIVITPPPIFRQLLFYW